MGKFCQPIQNTGLLGRPCYSCSKHKKAVGVKNRRLRFGVGLFDLDLTPLIGVGDPFFDLPKDHIGKLIPVIEEPLLGFAFIFRKDAQTQFAVDGDPNVVFGFHPDPLIRRLLHDEAADRTDQVGLQLRRCLKNHPRHGKDGIPMQARQTGKKEVRIPGSVSKWAMLLNVSRPSLHRELKRLEEDGIISCAAPMITILDDDALKDVLSR